MVPVFRFAAAALTAALVLSSAVVSQEAPDPDQPVLREYSTIGLTTAGFEQAPPPGAVGDLLAPDMLFGLSRDRELNQWSLRESGREAMCWPNAEELLCDVAGFCSLDQFNFDISTRHGRPNLAVLEAPPELHRRVEWVMKALRDLGDVRVNVRVMRLPDETVVPHGPMDRKLVATMASGAMLVGTATAGLGDPVILQKTHSVSYVADYNVSVATGTGAFVPVTSGLVTGEEVVAGVVRLPDGRLWIQGWHACSGRSTLRPFQTSGGQIELPTVRYAYSPISTVMENGGGVLIDSGEFGRFLVSATANGLVPDHELDCGAGSKLRLVNAVGVLRGYSMASRWLMIPTPTQSLDDGRIFGPVFIGPDDYVDGPYNDAAVLVANSVSNESHSCGMLPVGPFLGMRMAAIAEADRSEAMAVARLQADIDFARSGDNWARVKIRAIHVPTDAAVPVGVLEGRPSRADLDLLAALPDAAQVFERVSSAGLEQNMDLLDTRMAAMVAGYDVVTATQSAMHDPQVRTLLTGTQFRWVAREGRNGALLIESRAGITVGSASPDEVTVRLDGKEFAIHRARSNLVQARFSAELQPGESASHVCQAHADTEGLLVFTVTRQP